MMFVSSLIFREYSSDKQGSDQTVRMRRLVWAFAGGAYHIVGNLMSWLVYLIKMDPAFESQNSKARL